MAVIVALPNANPETTPLLTIATAAFEVDHVTLLFDPEGKEETLSGDVLPKGSDKFTGVTEIDVGGTGGVTVTDIVALMLVLLVEVAVIVAWPSF